MLAVELLGLVMGWRDLLVFRFSVVWWFSWFPDLVYDCGCFVFLAACCGEFAAGFSCVWGWYNIASTRFWFGWWGVGFGGLVGLGVGFGLWVWIARLSWVLVWGSGVLFLVCVVWCCVIAVGFDFAWVWCSIASGHCLAAGSLCAVLVVSIFVVF